MKLWRLPERAVTLLARHISGTTATALAALIYVAGVAVPLALHAHTFYLVAYSAAGALFAASVLMAWFLVQLEAAHRRKLVDWTTSLRLLSAEEFEWLVGEIFRRNGYEVEETGSQEGPDGNIDLRLSKDSQQKIVQCKRWQAQPVGIDEIRKFAGTLAREKLPSDAGIFVTLSTFNSFAEQEAKTLGLTLIDGRELDDLRQRVRRSVPCPICGESMLFDRFQYGWWFHCVTGDCKGKRDLGTDEGRAIEFLVQAPLTVPSGLEGKGSS
jgi:hypothetical protein